MVRWLAPICSFTADELWSFMPGERNDSVFLNQWYELPAMYSDDKSADEALAYWKQITEVRESVNKELEALRVAGEIGSGLAANVEVYCGREIFDILNSLLILSAIGFDYTQFSVFFRLCRQLAHNPYRPILTECFPSDLKSAYR